jgi:hypothetical protein
MAVNEEREMLMALEPELRTGRRDAPLPRRTLGRRTILFLWFLRIYVLIAVPLVVVAFVRALRS